MQLVIRDVLAGIGTGTIAYQYRQWKGVHPGPLHNCLYMNHAFNCAQQVLSLNKGSVVVFSRWTQAVYWVTPFSLELSRFFGASPHAAQPYLSTLCYLSVIVSMVALTALGAYTQGVCALLFMVYAHLKSKNILPHKLCHVVDYSVFFSGAAYSFRYGPWMNRFFYGGGLVDMVLNLQESKEIVQQCLEVPTACTTTASILQQASNGIFSIQTSHLFSIGAPIWNQLRVAPVYFSHKIPIEGLNHAVTSAVIQGLHTAYIESLKENCRENKEQELTFCFLVHSILPHDAGELLEEEYAEEEKLITSLGRIGTVLAAWRYRKRVVQFLENQSKGFNYVQACCTYLSEHLSQKQIDDCIEQEKQNNSESTAFLDTLKADRSKFTLYMLVRMKIITLIQRQSLRQPS